MKRLLQAGIALVLVLASGVAAALGLGQIQLKSGIGQPLLAEIPIISSDPSELEQLQAGLASPETFARIGLQAPDQVVANLSFVSALDAQGNPVIRVTSSQPINQPLLTFLIEVDWGQGRLVREYSALIDAPRTASAPLQPPIQAPVAAPSNTIIRAPEPLSSEEPAGVDSSPDVSNREELVVPPDEDLDVVAEDSSQTPDAGNEVPSTPDAPAFSPAPAVTPVSTARPDEYGVRQGQTLSGIAAELDMGVSLDQAMISLLRANPDAFIDSNINLVKQGAVLRVPSRDEALVLEVAEAMALVRTQVQQWRQASQPVPQPETASNADVADAASPDPGAATRQAGARLEIVPPGASSATRAGTQSGIAAGGEGDMQRQELATTKEALTAREAELAEMKSRVAELEKLQSQQQKLIEMKDTELAAVQQRLVESPATAGQESAALGWILGGGVLLLAAVVGAWLLQRRRADARPLSRSFRVPGADASVVSPLAAAFPTAAPVAGITPDAADISEAGRQTNESPRSTARPNVSVDRSATLVTSPYPAATTTSNPASPVTGGPVAGSEEDDGLWNRRASEQRPGKRAPAWHQDAGANRASDFPPAADRPIAANEGLAAGDSSDQDRLELARAYLNLGDGSSARQLLDEVAGSGDAHAREQAARMLRELG